MKLKLFFLLVISILLVTGCSDSGSTELEADKEVKRDIDGSLYEEK